MRCRVRSIRARWKSRSIRMASVSRFASRTRSRRSAIASRTRSLSDLQTGAGMADAPLATLVFNGSCPDCGERRVVLPSPLPAAGDDFDWRTRDYDSFRRFMLEELFARFPERDRWTDGDVEVVVVEAMAAVLDQLSDMADRVAGEAYLETARRPQSVRRLLKLIGYDALQLAIDQEIGPFATKAADGVHDVQRFEQYWLDNPTILDAARNIGPR